MDLYGLASHINTLDNFTARNVIVPNPRLRVDQVTLPYKALVELLQQQIINILTKTHSMSYNDAYTIWYKASLQKDPKIFNIIKTIINNTKDGIPIIINRNPTINYGSIMQMFCVDVTDTYTMGVPLQILKSLAADLNKVPYMW